MRQRLSSLQARLVAAFILFILLAMMAIGLLLLRGLQEYFLEEQRREQVGEAQAIALEVAAVAEGTPGRMPDAAGLHDVLGPFSRIKRLVLILDPTGLVLASSDESKVGQHFTAVPIDTVRLIEEQQPQSGVRLATESGTPRVWGAAPVLADEIALGMVYVESDLSRVYATLADIRRILFNTTLVALALTVLVGGLLARSITGPIQVLTAYAAAMAAGDFDRRIEVRSRDEIGRLGEMFNTLAARLKETLQQISDEKRKVEAIVTHMADGVVAFGPDGAIALINPAARRLLGATAAPEQLVGRRVEELWPDLDVAPLLDRVLGEALPPGDWPLLTVQRGGYTLRCVLAPIPGPDGQPGGAVWVLHDVTELERLEALRREFVANVSHELRTPLTTIKSYVETLRADVDDPDTRDRFLAVIDTEVDRMVRLVRDLLDLSQIELGRVRWEKEYVRLSELAAQVIARLRAQWEAKSLAVSLEAVDGEPAVYVDPDRMQQVIVNLLANALEFTPGGGRVTVRVRREGDEIVLEVVDTGVGIPPEDLPRVFDRFYRVDKARSRRLGGTGLGLSIVKEIVEAHGGNVGVESTPGRGTRVWLRLPVDGAVPPPAAGGGDDR